jgi:prevent-host-death family protein
MTRIGAYEAKTRFSELLDRVEKGESFEVTRHGKVVARLTALDAGALDRKLEAATRIRERLAAAQQREPRVAAAMADKDWTRIKAELEAEDAKRLGE